MQMMVFNQGSEAGEFFISETARLNTLVADMERILGRSLPETIADRNPPVLERWILAQRTVPCLVGLATGHATLPGRGRLICTSDLWLLSQDHTWARTLSRWYRLGRPFGHPGRDA
jgi:hypothetical protein